MATVPRLGEFQSVLPDTLLLLGVDGTILDNHVPQSAELFAPLEPLNGRHFSSALPAGLASGLEQCLELARTHPVPVTIEVDTTLNGKQRAYEVRLVNRNDNARLAIFRDITLRHRADQMVEHIASLRRDLAGAEKATLIARTTTAMSHEIGQPLTAILANADAASRLLDHPTPNMRELRKIADEIMVCAERATEIFDRLRDVLAKRQVTTGPVDINRVVEEIVLMTRTELLMRQVVVHTNLDSHLPAVSGARDQFQQVILNLLMNAADAVRSGEKPAIVITTSRVDGNVAVDVSDNGTGIAPQDFPRLFEPFFSNSEKGMGMGLSICWDIVHRQGGTIEVFNNAGEGAVFRVLLPALHSAPANTLPRASGTIASESVFGRALAPQASNDPQWLAQSAGGTAGVSAEVGEAIHRSRQVRSNAIAANLEACIHKLRLARIVRDPAVARRSVGMALVTLRTTDRLMQELGIPAGKLQELSLMRVQVLDLVEELN